MEDETKELSFHLNKLEKERKWKPGQVEERSKKEKNVIL